MDAHQLWFRSAQFEIEPGEEEETNPLCFGRQLANWLREISDQGLFCGWSIWDRLLVFECAFWNVPLFSVWRQGCG